MRSSTSGSPRIQPHHGSCNSFARPFPATSLPGSSSMTTTRFSPIESVRRSTRSEWRLGGLHSEARGRMGSPSDGSGVLEESHSITRSSSIRTTFDAFAAKPLATTTQTASTRNFRCSVTCLIVTTERPLWLRRMKRTNRHKEPLKRRTQWRWGSRGRTRLCGRFPDVQGKYREYRQILGSSDIDCAKNQAPCRVVRRKFPAIKKRDSYLLNRESVDRIRESKLAVPGLGISDSSPVFGTAKTKHSDNQAPMGRSGRTVACPSPAASITGLGRLSCVPDSEEESLGDVTQFSATATSADGSVVYGELNSGGRPYRLRAFSWTQYDGPTLLKAPSTSRLQSFRPPRPRGSQSFRPRRDGRARRCSGSRPGSTRRSSAPQTCSRARGGRPPGWSAAASCASRRRSGA